MPEIGVAHWLFTAISDQRDADGFPIKEHLDKSRLVLAAGSSRPDFECFARNSTRLEDGAAKALRGAMRFIVRGQDKEALAVVEALVKDFPTD